MTPEQYKKLKQKEQTDKANKKFGAFGPQTFKSRSLQSFQKDLEQGKTSHLMPVFNAKEKLKQGQIKQQDIPYMQRGGNVSKRRRWCLAKLSVFVQILHNASHTFGINTVFKTLPTQWDDSDVRGAKKKGWNQYDKQYDANAKPATVDWMGANQRKGPSAAAAKSAPKEAPKKKGWFGF